MTAKNTGQVTKDDDGYSVRFERHLNYDINTVWDAITNPEKLAIWFTDVEMELKPGTKMTIRFRDKDHTATYGRVKQVVAPCLFEFVWENDDGPDEVALWELFEEGSAKCKLVLTYSRLAVKYAANVPAGWHMMLDHLEDMLAGRSEHYPFDAGDSANEKKLVMGYATKWYEKFQPFHLSEGYGSIFQKDENYQLVFE
jgi:uncharacterized protein YndB with AHSA1/START domain